jgi:hypothetical protein
VYKEEIKKSISDLYLVNDKVVGNPLNNYQFSYYHFYKIIIMLSISLFVCGFIYSCFLLLINIFIYIFWIQIK